MDIRQIASTLRTMSKTSQFWKMLFFREDKEVLASLDEQIWKRTRMYMVTTGILVAVWGLFDFYMDYENLWFYLLLRAIYTPITLTIAYNFHRPFFRKHHKRWAMAHYLMLIIDIGIMVLWTDNFVKYLIGFSTIFWGAAIVMLWRFWNTVLPGIAVIIVAALRFYFFPHDVPTDEFITGLYYFCTCLVFTTVLSSSGYWQAYKREETNLKHVQDARLSSMNMVVAGVAHEIKTPVGTALTAVTHAEEEISKILGVVKEGEVSIDQLLNPANDALSSLEPARNELQRTAKLINTFKETAVDQSIHEKRRFDLIAYIKENIIAVSLNGHLKHINLTLKGLNIKLHGTEQLIIESYPGEYTQIFLNLFTNTINHGYEGKDLRDQAINIDIHINLLAPDSLLIRYQDDGSGMSPEVLSHVFEPFFTTAGNDIDKGGRGHRGTGLGMSIVYNAVTQKLGGEIQARSTAGSGAEFIMTLPIKVIKEQREG